MSQLTGNKTGTSYADRFIGTIDVLNPNDPAEKRAAIANASIYTYAGDDFIQGIATTAIQGTQVYGMYQGVINSGLGNDYIDLQATARDAAAAVGASSVYLDSDQGNDTITISAFLPANNYGGSTYGLINSTVSGGVGNDKIQISARTGWRVVGVKQATVLGGSNDDQISISAIQYGYGGTSTGVEQGTILGGSGNDQISIFSSVLGRYPSSFGLINGRVDGEEGNDIITIQSTGTAATWGGVTGVYQSEVRGGSGDDLIRITALPTQPYPDGMSGVGVSQSTIDGGDGNDTFVITGRTVAMQDAVIYGGNGRDTFDTGIGSGTVDGGADTDLAVLNFFNAATMNLQVLGPTGLRISGSTIYGTSWSQTIVNMEQFQVGSTIFNSAAAVADFLV